MEKWQERLISGWDTQELGQGVTSVPTEGESVALSRAKEVPQRTKDVVIGDVTASQLRNDGNEDGGTTAVAELVRATPWGIPIPDGWDATDPVFQHHPMECGCFRDGILRCGVPCVWAWPPGAKIGDKALLLAINESPNNRGGR